MNSIITIDGPAGSGKSTISRLLAKKIGFLYLDTGAMYRAVALAANRRGVGLDDRERLGDLCRSLDLHFNTDEDPPGLFLHGEDISKAIRSPEMDMAASTVSAVKEVRAAMTDLQRIMAKGLNIVAEGRDMGTVVFPGAAHKFFLTASVKERAERRYRERTARGESVSRDSVEEELRKRDYQDETRALAPLKPAEDAVIIDSTELMIEQVVDKIINIFNGLILPLPLSPLSEP
ncbi:MAG: (d)CMP kinase [Deltaproteobacteria bacterium]|nr:(d)CMP kinase [Deltaproteobacteria bacterium]